MNCKPNQLAWIVVPASQARDGLEALNRQVVRTIRLLPRQDMPIWEVEPRLTVKFARRAKDAFGQQIEKGEVLDVEGVPDYWLRPFDPNSEPLNEPAVRTLERTA